MVRVVNVRFSQPRNAKIGHGSNIFHLACGHEIRAKQSDGNPARKHCRECAQVQTT